MKKDRFRVIIQGRSDGRYIWCGREEDWIRVASLKGKVVSYIKDNKSRNKNVMRV